MPTDNIEEIKSKIDIADLIQEYIQLKPAGTNNFKALCPFHHEKTPSFMVSKDKQIWHCFGCFPKGSLVKTQRGFHSIEVVKKGDLVLTHKGRYSSVVRSLWRPYTGKMIDVRVRKLGETVSLTEDHKVFVIRTKNCSYRSRSTRICKWNCLKSCPSKHFKEYKITKISAGELSLNDYLLYPINLETKKINYINLDQFLTRKKYNFGSRIGDLPKKVKVNNDFLKLLGYWVAEGSNHRAYIRFSLGSHEEEFAQEIVYFIRKIFNITAAVHKRRGRRSGIEVTACNSNLANIFENLCGKGANLKHIPFEFQFLPPIQQRILLEAIWRGDGNKGIINKSKTKKEFKAITTISPILSEQLRDILLRLKFQPTVSVQDPKVDKHNVRHQKAFTIQWQEDMTLNFSNIYINKDSVYWLLPIKEIRKRSFNDLVFNLTVQRDHSYVVNNFVVGNCGEGGDIFGFVMKMEGSEFPEALRILAKKAGVQLQYRDPALQNQKTKLLDICKAAASFYHKILLDHPKAQFVRDYLKKRQVNEDTIETFYLGYAPDSWDSLNKYLVQKDFKEEDIFLAGLTIKKEKGVGYYDRFRNRLMFTIDDVHGNTIGFGGRWLGPEEENAAKYINSPQTLIYNKSYVLYGLDKAKQEIKKQKLAVIVEGYMDCLASHQAGVINVVASSGTALTKEQIKLLKRYTQTIAFAFDQDIAGEDASKRGIDVAWQEEMETKIICLPAGAKDPDELIKKEPKAWPEAIAKAQSIMEYYFDNTLAKADLNKVEDKKKVAKILLTVISKLADPIEQTHYLQKLASLVQVEEALLRDKLKQIKKPTAQVDQEEDIVQPKQDRFKSLAEQVVGLALSFTEHLGYITEQLEPDHLSAGDLQELYKNILIYYTKHADFETSSFFKEVSRNNKALWHYAEVLMLKVEHDFGEFDEEIIKKEIIDNIKELKRNYILQELKNLEREIKAAETQGDKEKITNYTEQFNQLTGRLRQLQ